MFKIEPKMTKKDQRMLKISDIYRIIGFYGGHMGSLEIFGPTHSVSIDEMLVRVF